MCMNNFLARIRGKNEHDEKFKEFFSKIKASPMTKEALEEYSKTLPKELKEKMIEMINIYTILGDTKDLEDLK